MTIYERTARTFGSAFFFRCNGAMETEATRSAPATTPARLPAGRPAFMRVPEAAQRLGISARRVRSLCRRGIIPASKLGRTWLIPVSKFEGFIRALEAGPPRMNTHEALRQRHFPESCEKQSREGRLAHFSRGTCPGGAGGASRPETAGAKRSLAETPGPTERGPGCFGTHDGSCYARRLGGFYL